MKDKYFKRLLNSKLRARLSACGAPHGWTGSLTPWLGKHGQLGLHYSNRIRQHSLFLCFEVLAPILATFV